MNPILMKVTVPCICLFLLVNFRNGAMAANRFWVASIASNWNNTANWSTVSGGAGGASVPGAADDVTFDTKPGNCTIDAAVSIKSITVKAAYTGAISQGANTISTSAAADFLGGTFTGGSVNMTIGGVFTLNGTAFTSTTAVFELNSNSTFSGGSFIHNNGTVKYNFTGSGSQSIAGTKSYVFYTLEFVGTGHTYGLPANNITVLNSLNLTGASFYNLSSGTIDVTGDINVSNNASGCAGTALININGTGAQNFTGSSSPGQGALPKLTINKVSGTLNLANYPTVSNDFTYTAGIVNAGSSTVCFTDGSQSPNNITGSITLNNISFIATTTQVFKIAATTTLTTNGDLSISGTAKLTLNTGNINVAGNIFLTNTATGGGGTALINIVGTGNETIDGTAVIASQSLLPFITINKASGTLTLKGIISESQDWTYMSGTVDASTFGATVVFGGNSLAITSAGMNFYHVTVTANTSTLTNSLSINGNLTINGTGILSAGANTIYLSGNWINRGTAGFTEATSTVNFNGSSLQTITSTGGENFSNLIVNNSGPGIQLINNTTIATTLTMTQGNINLNGNSLVLGVSVANIGTLARVSGTMIGTGSFIRWFKAVTVADGSVTGLFPMGTVTDCKPIFVSAPATAPTTGGTIAVAYTNATTNSGVRFPDGLSTVLLRKNLSWSLTTANGLAGGTFHLRADGTGFGTIVNVADLRLTLTNSVVGAPGTNAGTTTYPQISRTGLSLANLSNTFYVGSVSTASSLLPITLISFTASVVSGKVKLDWVTTTETNKTTILPFNGQKMPLSGKI